MARFTHRTGKQVRPKTAVKGKRFRCAGCRKRSPKPVKTLAPWYCPNCLRDRATASESGLGGARCPSSNAASMVVTEKLQPILKVDPRDRDTWIYPESDICFKP